MRFGIVVPVYNVEAYLMRCLNSIYEQNYDDYEVILVDDGSTDSSGSICDEYASNHPNTRVIHKINQGLISARREGFRASSADYIINCDSDDYLESEILSTLSEVIDNHAPDIVLYNSYIDYDNHKDIFYDHIFAEGMIEDKKVIYDELLLTHKINSLCMKAYKRSLIDLERDYSELYKYNYGEDLLQSVPLIIKADKIYYLDKALYNYRMHSGMMAKYNNVQYWSYKAVYMDIKEKMADLHIEDFECKLSTFLVARAYDAIRLNYAVGEYHEDDVMQIAKDDYFVSAYKCIRNSSFMNCFTIKQRIILCIISHKIYALLKILMKLSMRK